MLHAFGAGSSLRDFFGTFWLLTGVVFVEGGGGRLDAKISASDAWVGCADPNVPYKIVLLCRETGWVSKSAMAFL